MENTWQDNKPIYRQLADQLRDLILQKTYLDNDALPSVREIAANHQLNPITVSKSFRVLVDEGLVTKRRGLGMFVVEGAREKLIKRERTFFVEWELPRIKQRAEDLGFNVEILIEEHT